MLPGRRLTSQPRIDRSFGYSRPADIGRVRGVISLSLLVYTAEARAYVDSLHKRVRRLMSWYAALHRTGGGGWRGTECHYEAMSEAIAGATGEAMSVGTLKRAMAGAVQAGLLSLSWCTPARRDADAGKVEIAPGVWRTLRIRRATLTPKAIALWSRKPGRNPQETPAGPAGPGSSPGVSASSLPGSKSSSILRVDTSLRESNTGRVAPSDRGSGLVAGSNAVESTPRSPATPAPTIGHGVLNEAAATGAAASGRTDGRSGFAVGVEQQPPQRPKPTAPATWDNGRRALLADLAVFLAGFPRRQASCLYARARVETAPGWPVGRPRAMAWDHWVPRWRSMIRAERFGALRRNVLPALLAAAHMPGPDGLGQLLVAAPPTPLGLQAPAAAAVANTPADLASLLRSIGSRAAGDAVKRARCEEGARRLLERARAMEERDRKRFGV